MSAAAEERIYRLWLADRPDTPELRRAFFESIERLTQAGLIQRAAEPRK